MKSVTGYIPIKEIDVNEEHAIVEGYHEEGVEAADRVVTLVVPDVQEVPSRVEYVISYFQEVYNAD